MKTAFIISGKSPTTMPGGLGSYSYNVAKSFFSLGYRVYVVGISDKDEVLESEFCTFVHVRSELRKLASVTAFIMMRQLVPRILNIMAGHEDSEFLFYGAGIWGRVGNLVKQEYPGNKSAIHTTAAYFTTFEHEYRGQVKGSPARDYGIFYNLMMKTLFGVIKVFYVPKEHKTLKEIDRIIVHYESSRQILVDEIPGLSPEKIIRIPYFIESYERKGVNVSVKKHTVSRIVCICRQDPRKGINSLLHAVAILKKENRIFDCVIAGSGPFLGPNRKLAVKLGISDIVHFPGFISSIEETLDAGDIYAFPSVEEGSGAISLLEAMKVGLPIVTTWCDGIPEDFIDGETALLAYPDDAGSFANRLRLLLDDVDLRKKMGKQVKQAYVDKFTLEGMTEGIRELSELF